MEELDKLLMVQLRDGRKIMGILRCAGPCSMQVLEPRSLNLTAVNRSAKYVCDTCEC